MDSINKPDQCLRLSVVIPTLNAESQLGACLASIRQQNLPSRDYEIVVADGGSTDATRQLAVDAGTRVIDNPYRAAEPGVALGIRESNGQFITVMAADNRIRGHDFFDHMLKVFDDPKVVAAFPRVASTSEDGAVSRYINHYTDPFNHFVYGSVNTSLDLMLSLGRNTIGLSASDAPLLALAQGCTVRRGSVSPESPQEADDVLAIIQLLRSGGKLALVGGAEMEHHSASGLRVLYRKYMHRTQAVLRGRQGNLRRLRYMSRRRRIRRWLWPAYSATVIGPILYGAALAVRYGDRIALFHPVINTVVFVAVVHGWLSARRGHKSSQRVLVESDRPCQPVVGEDGVCVSSPPADRVLQEPGP
jgi:glycosyltransferase involved in cell wall biosynthesis